MAKSVLVVEDNELNLKLFCDLLRAHGYEAEPVRDGREAVERTRAFEPDLVIMDIQMPHVSGLDLIIVSAQQIAKQPQVEFVVLDNEDFLSHAPCPGGTP